MTDGRGLPRREFLKSAVAIGGAAAFSACLGRGDVTVPTGSPDSSSYPDRQHAWNEVLPTDEAGNTRPPRHRVLLFLSLADGAVPTDDDRETFETAIRGVERAYERSANGLLLTISYSPSYFDRFAEPLGEGPDLPAPEPLAPFEDPEFDTPDAVVHLASNTPEVVLGAEGGLKGELATVNEIEQPDASVTDVFDVTDRRTGFIGEGLPAEKASEVDSVSADAVSREAPMFMGFKSGFERNQPSEDRVTIQEGPFAGGTTQHLSKLHLDLDQWYNQDDRWQREAKMFCPHHAENGLIEGSGENLGTDTRIEDCRPVDETAREKGVVGHSQKSAEARDETDSPLILRRDFNSTGDGSTGLHFLSLQRRIADFVDTREAMNGSVIAEESAIGQRNNNGILQYIRTLRRGNYLVPPRSLRALPPPNPEPVRTE
ncbi:MAG: Tat pathway signal protein [Halodesulfurarchaeum sp.]|nr:Tat pathway signal protein [Halodesulfurarchaeum sp.]